MIKIVFAILPVIISLSLKAQTHNSLPATNEALLKRIHNIRTDTRISSDSAWEILSHWNQYPSITAKGRYELFIFQDPVFGSVPFKVFIPGTYNCTVPNPAVLLLHGAVVLSSFKDAFKDTTADEDLFYRFFEANNFIIVRPFADSKGPNTDGTKLFDWVVNHRNGRVNKNKTNPTFATLAAVLSKLKEILNIDDNRLYAFGHSDGADGVFALQVYKPSLFAGFIVFNSMLTNIFAYDMYLRNTFNRPLYMVHSDLDDLRPIQQTREQVKLLDSLKSPVLYKEYHGYKHFDQHLQKDLPFAFEWMEHISRNPFQNSMQWELSDTSNNTCDWLRVLQIDTSALAFSWHTEINMKTYNKRNGKYYDDPYYSLNKSALVKASFFNNRFDIETSRTKEIELLISPVMVNQENPVVITVNGKELFNKKIIADKDFLLDGFLKSFDRSALWITSINLQINPF
jgi:predicted esterase